MSGATNGFVDLPCEVGHVIELVMPPSLDGAVRARILASGPICDEADGMAEPMYRALCGTSPRALIAPRQVHGAEIAPAELSRALPHRDDADGLHLDRSFDGADSVAASLRYADCAPVVLASARPRPWCMILHSGFKGTTLAILTRAFELAQNFYGELDPSSLHVWIGPSICVECYTRRLDDPSTAGAMRTWHEANFERRGDVVHFDIRREIASQASDVGVLADNVYTYPRCTACCGDGLYSYRRGDLRRRMLLVAELTS